MIPIGPVSYTHLDVYKRQPRLCAKAPLADEVNPTTRGVPGCPRRSDRQNAVPKAVLLEALDSSNCRAPKLWLSARKSSIRKPVKNSGRSTACLLYTSRCV